MTARSGVPAILAAADDMAAVVAERDRYRAQLERLHQLVDAIPDDPHAAMVAEWRALADGLVRFTELQGLGQILGADRVPWTAAEIRAEADRLEREP